MADKGRGCGPEETKPDCVPPLSSNPLEFLLPRTFCSIYPPFILCTQLDELNSDEQFVENAHTTALSSRDALGNEDSSCLEFVVAKRMRANGVPKKPGRSGIRLKWLFGWVEGRRTDTGKRLQ